ncbi:MAG: glycosyltransferase family 9 protein, partial [Proteobacteria bacterium]|nr:glycosyltransferase family 9 protein [Pseudomonadota bacterium]
MHLFREPRLIEPLRSLCILRLSAIGDVCHTLPVVRTLQDHWPETHITWIIGKLEHSLLAGIPGIEFLPFDKRGGIAAFRDIKRQLNDRRFDALLHMQVALRASILSLGVRADRRIGFDKSRAKDWQWLFTNRRIAARKHEHVMDGLYGFADALGVPRGEPRWDIPMDEEDARFAARIIPAGQRTLVISPCSSQRARNFRNWPVSRFIDVATHATNAHGMAVIVTGGRSELEREYAEQISNAIPACTNLVGGTGLKQLHAVLARATVLVSPDSGPVHMANAAGTPVIGLYATSNPERTGPYLNREWTVNRYPDAVRKFLGREPG